MTGRVQGALSKLERRSLTFILAARVKDNNKIRAYAMAQILPYDARRLIYMARRISLFYRHAIKTPDSNKSHASRNWENFSRFSSVAAYLRMYPLPPDPEKVGEWYSQQETRIKNRVWGRANIQKRHIPFKDGEHPPALVDSSLSPQSRRKAALWYLNTIKMKQESRPRQPRLKQLLEQFSLNETEAQELEQILQEI